MADGGLGQKLCMALCAALLLAGCGEDPAVKACRQGIQALKRGHYNQSIRLLQKSILLGGTNVSAAILYNSLGLAYHRIGQPENALSAFEQSAQLDPQSAEPVYNTGVIMAESGREVQAAACFEKAARLDASGTRALEYLGWIFSQSRRWDQSRKVLNEARRRAPRDPRVLTAMALVELQATNIAPAISCLQEALEHDAGYVPAIFNLAVVNRLWLKNDSQAAQLFKDYLRLAPKGEGAEQASQALRDIDGISPSAGRTPAMAPLPANAPDTAAKSAPASPVKTGPKKPAPPVADKAPPVPPAPACEDLLKVARKLEQQGRAEAAVNNYLLAAREAERAGKPSIRDQAAREANRLCDRNARAHYEVGLYWVERGQPDEALAHLKQAAELSNTWFEAHFAAARVAVEKNEFDTALISLKKADQCSPDRSEALWMLAQLYDRNLNLTNQAIQAYELFEKRFGEDGRAQEGRSRLQALKGGRTGNQPAESGKTGTQTRWRWLFKPRPQNNPEN